MIESRGRLLLCFAFAGRSRERFHRTFVFIFVFCFQCRETFETSSLLLFRGAFFESSLDSLRGLRLYGFTKKSQLRSVSTPPLFLFFIKLDQLPSQLGRSRSRNRSRRHHLHLDVIPGVPLEHLVNENDGRGDLEDGDPLGQIQGADLEDDVEHLHVEDHEVEGHGEPNGADEI